MGRVHRWAQVGMWALVLMALWGHRVPVGIDLPQHAQLVAMMESMGDGPMEFDRIYRVNFFTPYLLPYGLTFVFAKLIGVVNAIKLTLTLAAFATWAAARRWLAVVGGRPSLAVLSLPAFFGFSFLWGFLSNCVALPLAFFYLATLERALKAPSLRTVLALLGWGVALFFSHGITFGIAMLCGAVRLLLTRDWRAMLNPGLHLLPLALLTLGWLRSAPRATTPAKGPWFITVDRLITLFAGYFSPKPELLWAGVTVAALAAYLLATRPGLNRRATAWLPLVIPLFFIVLLPDVVADTFLVAERLCVFLYVAFPALLVARGGRARWLRAGALALTLGFLALLNWREAAFNRELAGLWEISALIPPGGDINNAVSASDHTSPTFGRNMLGQVAAWVAVEKRSFIDNDSSGYLQMPLQKRSKQFPLWFDYIITHGELAHATSAAHARAPHATLMKSVEGWQLFQRPRVELEGLQLLRASQEWGQLGLNLSVSQRPLTIAGEVYERGLGTHARSLLRLRATRDGTLTGRCGLDVEGQPTTQVRCLIWQNERTLAFDSGPITQTDAAKAFQLPVARGEEIVLEAQPMGSIAGAHVDWVQLRL